MASPQTICSAILGALQIVGIAGSVQQRKAIAWELSRLGGEVARLWFSTVEWFAPADAAALSTVRSAPREDDALVWAPVTNEELLAITGVPTMTEPEQRLSYDALSAYPPLAICFALDACAGAMALDFEAGYGVLSEAGEVHWARGAFERAMVIKASRRLLDVVDHELRGLLSREFGVELASVRSAYRVAEGYGAEHPTLGALQTAGVTRRLEAGWEHLRDFGFTRRIAQDAPVGLIDWVTSSKRLRRRDWLRGELARIPARLLSLSHETRKEITEIRDEGAPWHALRDAFVELVITLDTTNRNASFGHWVDVSPLLALHRRVVAAWSRTGAHETQFMEKASQLETSLRALQVLERPYRNAYVLTGQEAVRTALQSVGRAIVSRFGVMLSAEELMELLARAESPLVHARV